ncbi:putative small lipoprotein YifL [Siphonobacter sp. BAB-5404]|nr:putative small lipoprotein YifL [Siphonobacter sp. SORGH_AS_1065]MDR6193366.1 putative small lipoprotein YifL [Siphonobacter sp. SORGH_AS_0500]
MKKSAYLIALLAVLSLASCARKNNCPAYGNTSMESTKR